MTRGPVVLLVADGASEPLRARRRTSLERARTPALDQLLSSGVLQRARTIPEGLEAGTEVGIPTLLGAAPVRPPSRGLIEALAADIPVASGQAAWRLDVVPPRTPTAEQLRALAAALEPLGAGVHHLGAHRCLLVGPAEWGDAPLGPHQDPRAGEEDAGAFDAVIRLATEALAPAAARPWGRVPVAMAPAPRARHTTVVTAGGAVAGIGRLLGCRVEVCPPREGAELVADAAAGQVVLIHDPGPDDAGHACDPAAKVAAIERFDCEVVAPVAAVLQRRGGRLIVATDHGCDPRTGRHDGEPVPVVLWAPGSPEGGARPRWTERAAAALGIVPAEILLDEQLRMAA